MSEHERQSASSLQVPRVRCVTCGAEFTCAAPTPGVECWCESFPPVTPQTGADSCLCPACLAAATS